MLRLASIVEGHGECEAVPILVRRIAQTLDPPLTLTVQPVLRVPASRLLKQGEVERAVEFAARKNAGQGGIFVLLDADDGYPAQDALRHYEVGVRIGELPIGTDLDGLLPWGYINNRPFLRCLNGFGLCLWRLNRFAEAERVFDRMLWLNPTDNQGVRFLIDEVRARKPWTGDWEKR